jgi:hypothetical protein
MRSERRVIVSPFDVAQAALSLPKGRRPVVNAAEGRNPPKAGVTREHRRYKPLGRQTCVA